MYTKPAFDPKLANTCLGYLKFAFEFCTGATRPVKEAFSLQFNLNNTVEFNLYISIFDLIRTYAISVKIKLLM